DGCTRSLCLQSCSPNWTVFIKCQGSSVEELPESSTIRRHSELSHNQRQNVSLDRKSTRLNSSHSQISYAVFCLKKKTKSAISAAMLTSSWQSPAQPSRSFTS